MWEVKTGKNELGFMEHTQKIMKQGSLYFFSLLIAVGAPYLCFYLIILGVVYSHHRFVP